MKARRNLRWCDVEKDNIPLAKLVSYFETYNKTEGKSAKTVIWYNQALHQLLDWLDAAGYESTLGPVGEEQVREFILSLQNKRWNGHLLTPNTINNRVRALRAFFNWLYHSRYTEEHLLQNVRPPRLPQMMVETLSDHCYTCSLT